MLPDQVSNPGPLTWESGALRGPAQHKKSKSQLPELRQLKSIFINTENQNTGQIKGTKRLGLKLQASWKDEISAAWTKSVKG